jgi:hypothetical protein
MSVMNKIATGNLRKMQVTVGDNNLAQYQLRLQNSGIEKLIDLNQYIGQHIELGFLGEINCIHCARKTNKSYQQGYCYPCMMQLAECDLCIVRPERCHYERGTCRDESWAHAHCGVPHIVYLANTSGLKVGITRATQVPTRWLDQGAMQAMPVFEVANRFQSGTIEVALAKFVQDKTNWRKMLQQDSTPMDMVQAAENLLQEAQAILPSAIDQFKVGDIKKIEQAKIYEFKFPVLQYPEKVKSQSFDKQEIVSGKLNGIKGQYLLLETGVINMRKFAGYKINFSVGV